MNFRTLNYSIFIIASLLLMLVQVIKCQPKIQIINIEKAFEEKKTINCSEFITNIDYIQLETGESIPLCGPQPKFIVTTEIIISISLSNILIFNRFDGKFIRQLGEKGDMPNQYSSTNKVFPYDDKRNILLANGQNNSILTFNLNTNLVNKLNTPSIFGNTIYWKENKYIQYISNISGEETRKLVLFNSENNILKVYPNSQHFNKSLNNIYYSNSEGMFYKFRDSLYFKERFNDTVFYVSESELIPKYIFNTGKYKVNYQSRAIINLQNRHTFLFIENMYETENYLFFQVNFHNKIYAALFNKRFNSTEISYWQDQTLRYGFSNDIDNFLPFYFSSVSSNNELVGFCIPYETKHWVVTSSNQVFNQAQNDLINNNNEESNPIILIAKLKNK